MPLKPKHDKVSENTSDVQEDNGAAYYLAPSYRPFVVSRHAGRRRAVVLRQSELQGWLGTRRLINVSPSPLFECILGHVLPAHSASRS